MRAADTQTSPTLWHRDGTGWAGRCAQRRRAQCPHQEGQDTRAGWPADTRGRKAFCVVRGLPGLLAPRAKGPTRLYLPTDPSHLQGGSRPRGQNSNRICLGDHPRCSWVGTKCPEDTLGPRARPHHPPDPRASGLPGSFPLPCSGSLGIQLWASTSAITSPSLHARSPPRPKNLLRACRWGVHTGGMGQRK